MAQPSPPRSPLGEWLDQRLDLHEVVGGFFTLTGMLYGGLDRRLELREAMEKALNKPVPKHNRNFTYCLGGLTFSLFVVQAITGILMTLYYRPSPEMANESVRQIVNNVHFGWLIRGIHTWGANLMILCVMAHMFKVFWIGAYKPPRELNWMVGVVLLLVTLAFGFTGYLLPWDNRAYWATTVGTEIARSVPFIGDFAVHVLRGGAEVTGDTLARFYSFHVIILPITLQVFMMLHFLIIRRQGISGPI